MPPSPYSQKADHCFPAPLNNVYELENKPFSQSATKNAVHLNRGRECLKAIKSCIQNSFYEIIHLFLRNRWNVWMSFVPTFYLFLRKKTMV